MLRTRAGGERQSFSPTYERNQNVQQMRVAVVCDLLEEGWQSMDMVADMLVATLERDYSDVVAVSCIRPPMRRRATSFIRAADYLAVGSGRGARFLFNVDRVLNRFWDYPNFLSPLRSAYDVFHIVDHSYAQLVHVLPPERTVVTCHDLEAFRPVIEPSRGKRPALYQAMAKRILAGFAKAARVACVSATVRDELLAYGLVSPEKLMVAPNGVHPACTPRPQSAADSEAARLLGPWAGDAVDLLHVGSTIPRKRLDVLLRVFAGLRIDFPSIRLIRVGGPFTPAQASLVKQLGLDDSIVALPFLDRNVLAAVYRRAALVLQPSEAEGFGLPVIEALACGTPVVASDIPVMKEVGGDAATYCRMGDVGAWQQQIVDLLVERTMNQERWLARRLKGIRHASAFSWEANAGTMVSLYQEILAA